MRWVGGDGAIYDMPDPKVQLTQELLGAVHDELDSALDFIECVYQATYGPDLSYDATLPLRAVLDAAKQKVSAAKDRIHTTIAWAPS